MSWGDEVWAVLGIAPTAERRAIRKAYAAKLKAIDPDADIAAFQELRHALETAEWMAKHTQLAQSLNTLALEAEAEPTPKKPRGRKPAKAEVAGEASEPEPAPPPKLTVTVKVTPPPPAAPPDPAIARRKRFQVLVGKRKPSEDEQAELLALYEELRTDERMQAIDFADQFENWLAGLLLSGGRGGDRIVPLAVQHFGWHRELTAINPRHSQCEVARLAEDLRCIAALSEPGHQWHEAFVLLRQPVPDQIDRGTRQRLRPQVHDLLQSLRWHNPGVERRLNRQHVTMWEGYLASSDSNRDALFRSTGVSWWTVVMVIWFVLAILRFATQASAPGPLEQSNVAIPVEEATVPGAPANPYGSDQAAPALPKPTVFVPQTSVDSKRGAELAQEIGECMGPNPPKRTSKGTFDCEEFREKLKPRQ